MQRSKRHGRNWKKNVREKTLQGALNYETKRVKPRETDGNCEEKYKCRRGMEECLRKGELEDKSLRKSLQRLNQNELEICMSYLQFDFSHNLACTFLKMRCMKTTCASNTLIRDV